MNKIDAIIRVIFKMNPEEMTDREWVQRFQEWNYVNRLQLATQEAMLEKVLIRVTNKIFKAIQDGQKAKK